MAQETAGTIGIPVIKNEILPFVVDYGKRRQRAEELQAQRKMRQEALLYKQQQEEGKFALPAPASVKGGYFSHIVSKNNADRMNILTDAVKSKKYTQGELTTLGRSAVADTESENSTNEFQTRKIDEEAKRASDLGLEITPNVIAQYAQNQSDLNTDHSKKIEQFALSNPANINPAKIARNALKDEKPSSFEFINSRGQKEQFESLPVFDIEEATAPGGQKIYRANKVNIEKAAQYVNRQPKLAEYRDAWISGEARKKAADPYGVYANLPEQERNTRAFQEATNDFYNQAFGGMGVEKYGIAAPKKGGAAGGGAEEYKRFTVAPSTLNIANADVPVYSVTPAKNTEWNINVPPQTNYTDPQTGRLSKISTGETLLNPNFGYAATVKPGKVITVGGKTYTSGNSIPASEWKNVPIGDVQLKYGMYGTGAQQQLKMTKEEAIRGGGTFQNPLVLTQMKFFGESALPAAVTQAKEIFRQKGTSYDRVKRDLLSQYQSYFKKFKTSKK